MVSASFFGRTWWPKRKEKRCKFDKKFQKWKKNRQILKITKFIEKPWLVCSCLFWHSWKLDIVTPIILELSSCKRNLVSIWCQIIKSYAALQIHQTISPRDLHITKRGRPSNWSLWIQCPSQGSSPFHTGQNFLKHFTFQCKHAGVT